jgi:hypothetical protein
MLSTIEGIGVPDSKLASEITELVRDTESPLLYHHSRRVYYWGALSGQRRGLAFDPELLYAGAMFHDIGLTPRHRSPDKRFEVDGANAARTFLRAHAIAQQDIDTVWTAIALHTTPGIPEYMHPVVALVTAGVEMDVLGLGYDTFSAAERDAVVRQHPRGDHFKDNIIQAFYDGIHQMPGHDLRQRESRCAAAAAERRRRRALGPSRGRRSLGAARQSLPPDDPRTAATAVR